MQRITNFAHSYHYFISKNSRIKNIKPQPSVLPQGNDLRGQTSSPLLFCFFLIRDFLFIFIFCFLNSSEYYSYSRVGRTFSCITYIVLCDGVTGEYYNKLVEDNILIVVDFSLTLAFLDIWVVHHVNLTLHEHRIFWHLSSWSFLYSSRKKYIQGRDKTIRDI